MRRAQHYCVTPQACPEGSLSHAPLVPYHDAGVGLVVVGGVHALEPLLACCVPKVCNMNTALTASWGWRAERPGHTEHVCADLCVQKQNVWGGQGGTQATQLTCVRHQDTTHLGVSWEVCVYVHGGG